MDMQLVQLRDHPLNGERKLFVDKQIFWNHHRGGWRFVVKLIAEQLHRNDGTRFVTAVEDELFPGSAHYAGPIREPWVGFIHQVPKHALNFPDLERLLKLPSWQESIPNCLGLWTLTKYQRRYLQSKGVDVEIASLYYPGEIPEVRFSLQKFLRSCNKKLLFVGAFLRNFQAFYDLKVASYQKVLLIDDEIVNHMRKKEVASNETVVVLDRVSDSDYDQLLRDNIVFLNVFDSGASTTVVECIIRRTPILTNRVGGLVEYLGDDYPLYYNTLDEAAAKAEDLDLIQKASEYLDHHWLHGKLTGSYFLRSLQESTIYQRLP
jgi:hypothetical protein